MCRPVSQDRTKEWSLSISSLSLSLSIYRHLCLSCPFTTYTDRWLSNLPYRQSSVLACARFLLLTRSPHLLRSRGRFSNCTVLHCLPREESNERKTDGQLSFSCHFLYKNINPTLSPSPLSSSILLLYVSLTFSFTLYPHFSPRFLTLAGRCWQQFSTSGPVWQLGQGLGAYQKWH